MLRVFNDLRIATKIYFVAGIFLSALATISLVAIVLLTRLEAEIVEVAEEDIPLIEALTEVNIAALEQAVLVERILPDLLSDDDRAEIERAFKKREAHVDEAMLQAREIAKEGVERAINAESKAEFKKLSKSIEILNGTYSSYKDQAEQLIADIRQGKPLDKQEVVSLETLQHELDDGLIEALREIERFTARSALHAEQAGALTLKLVLASSLIGTVLGLVGIWLLVRGLAKPVMQVRETIVDLANGLETNIPCLGQQDEIGDLARSLDVVYQKGLESARLRAALDGASTMVMVTNRRNEIIYVNPALQNHLASFEADIRKELPQFTSQKIVGGSIDAFHKNPSHQRSLLDGLVAARSFTFTLGGRHIELSVSPVLGQGNTVLGAVAEWRDATQDEMMRTEMDEVISAASSGDFSRKMDVSLIEGNYRDLADGMNRLVTVVDHATTDIGRMLEATAKGELDQRIDTDYQGRFGELKDNANRTSAQLTEIVEQVQTVMSEVSAAAGEIASGTSDLSDRTEQASANIEETAASTEQMSATVKQNAENAKNANQLADSANQVASQGGEVVEKAVVAMSGIEQSAQKITDIISVIDEIAFQTNLLALNASVEAARAGEAGKGFAVVAQEVRQLAQRSAQAATDIKILIQDSNGQVKDGVELVNQAGGALGQIVGSIAEVASIVREISSASQEQASGIHEINGSISSMDEMTQQNSAMVEESTAAARALSNQAEKLSELMAFFKLGASATAKGQPSSRSKPLPRAGAVQAPLKPESDHAAMARTTDDSSWAEF